MPADHAYDSQVECPLCRIDDVVALSGRIPHLWVDPHRDPPMACEGIHGRLPAEVLLRHGISPTPPDDPGSGLAPSRPTGEALDAGPATTPASLGAPDGVSRTEQESAYRDAPLGDIREEPLDEAQA